ncbi:MAG: S9 family peptidase [Bacteroidales bacterium]
MKKFCVVVYLVLSFLSPEFSFAKNPSEITLDAIYRDWVFYPNAVRGIRSMNDGKHYTILENRKKINKHSYATGKLVEVVFDQADLPDFGYPVEEYSFSGDESKILIQTRSEPIYRHSFRASYYIYEISTGTLKPLSQNGKQQLATFSPTGDKVGFVRGNNLYYVDLTTMEEKQVTYDGEHNNIINGAPDWVYEEEFGFSKGFAWSPDGNKLAYYRFDESHVRQFNMTMYEGLYPDWYQFKYPKAGEDNSIVDIHIYHLDSEKTVIADTGEETDVYFPRIKWTKDKNVLAIIRLNRLQNHVEVLLTDAQSGNTSIVFSEKEDKYISETSDDFITFLPENAGFVVISERSGYSHFYRYDMKGNLLNPVTSGEYDIINLIGIDDKDNRLYYRSHEASALQSNVYSVKLNGKAQKRLSLRDGTNDAFFSKTYEYYINRFSDANTPPVYTLHQTNGKQLRVLEDNSGLQSRMEAYNFVEKTFFKVPTENDLDLNGYMIKPGNFDPSKKYPVLMYVYGGPESQLVTDEFSMRDAWFQMLAQKGYIIACVDNRGTNGRGEAFKKATYLELGKLETEDQITAAKYLGSLDYVDAGRIGIFGWSYGGYMSLLCMTKGATYFKLGIAVAPVTNWRYYDTIYTERFMRKPQDNPDGYDDNSPINHVDKLKGKLLLVHGMGDDNVHFQNSVEITEKLVQANKQFDMQFYPNKNHGIYGGNTTYHLYTRMTDYILNNL